MVYIKQWQDYTTACQELCLASPNQTRYCIKWRHDLGLLVLKVTDNRKCIKFKTRSSIFLNRFEVLNRHLIALFQDRQKQAVVEPVRVEGTATAMEGIVGEVKEGVVPAGEEGPAAEEGKSKKKKKGKTRK